MRQELFQDVIDAVNAGYTSILFLEELDDQQLETLNQTIEAQEVVVDEIILYALGSNIIEFIRPIVRNINKFYLSYFIQEEAKTMIKNFIPSEITHAQCSNLYHDTLYVDNFISSSGVKLLLKALGQGYMCFNEIKIHREISPEELELLKDISNNGFILPQLAFNHMISAVELAMVKSILNSKIQYKSLSFEDLPTIQGWENFLSEIEFKDSVQEFRLTISALITHQNFLIKNNVRKLMSKINNISGLSLRDEDYSSQEGCLDPLFEHLSSSNNKIKYLGLKGFSRDKSLFSKLPVNNLFELGLDDYSDSTLHDQLLPQITSSSCKLEALHIQNFSRRDDFLLKNSIQFYQKLVYGPIYLKHFSYSCFDKNFNFPYKLLIKLLKASCLTGSKLEALYLECRNLDAGNIDQILEIIRHPNFKLKTLKLFVEKDVLSEQHLADMADSTLLYFNFRPMPIVEQLKPAASFIYEQGYNDIKPENKYQAYMHLWHYIEYRDSIPYVIQREILNYYNEYMHYEEDPKLTDILLEHYFHIMKVLPEEYDPLFVEVGSGDNKTYIGFKQNKLLEHNSKTILFALPLEIRMLITEYILAAPKAAPSPAEINTESQNKVDDSDLYYELAGAILDIGE